MANGGMKLFERREIDITMYQSSTIETFFPTEKEARAEYSRLRSIATKRLERLEKRARDEHDIIQSDARRVLDKTGEFAKLSTINGKEVYTQLERVARFLNSAESSPSTLREKKKKQLASLRENPKVMENARAIKKASTESKKDDVRESEATSELEETEETEDDEEITDADLDNLLMIYEKLDNWGLSYLKYNDDILDYLATNPDTPKEELLKMETAQQAQMEHEQYIASRRERRNARRRQNRRR